MRIRQVISLILLAVLPRVVDSLKAGECTVDLDFNKAVDTKPAWFGATSVDLINSQTASSPIHCLKECCDNDRCSTVTYRLRDGRCMQYSCDGKCPTKESKETYVYILHRPDHAYSKALTTAHGISTLTLITPTDKPDAPKTKTVLKTTSEPQLTISSTTTLKSTTVSSTTTTASTTGKTKMSQSLSPTTSTTKPTANSASRVKTPYPSRTEKTTHSLKNSSTFPKAYKSSPTTTKPHSIVTSTVPSTSSETTTQQTIKLTKASSFAKPTNNPGTEKATSDTTVKIDVQATEKSAEQLTTAPATTKAMLTSSSSLPSKSPIPTSAQPTPTSKAQEVGHDFTQDNNTFPNTTAVTDDEPLHKETDNGRGIPLTFFLFGIIIVLATIFLVTSNIRQGLKRYQYHRYNKVEYLVNDVGIKRHYA